MTGKEGHTDMTPQQIVGLGVRLVAVWVAIRAIFTLLMNARAFWAMDMADKALNTSVLTAFWIAVALVLWLFPMWIAHKLIPRTRFEDKLNLQPMEAARVGCCLICLWLLSNELHSFVWFVFKGALTPGDVSVIRHFSPEEQVQFAVVSTQVAFALFLTFGSGRFVALALREPAPLERSAPEVGGDDS
jgi:hypothetical protein